MDNSENIESNEKELHKKMIESTNQEIRDFFKGSKAVLKNHQNPVKYSEIFHDFMQPAIYEVLDDEEILKRTLNWGQLVWNKVVAENFPNNEKSKHIEAIFPLFKNTFFDQTLLETFLKRKKEIFGDKNFFIAKQSSLLDTNGRLSISVAALPVE